MAKHDFLDPEQQHILSEQECELITFYRALSPTKRSAVLNLLFSMLQKEAGKRAARKKAAMDV